MKRSSQYVAGIALSGTMAIDMKAKALKAEGHNVISFAAGEPDFPTPAHIVAAAHEAVDNPANYKYTPVAGLQKLREQIAASTKQNSGYDVDFKQVVVTNGGKHAVSNAILAIADRGDEVLLPAPYWTSYPEMIYLAGAKTVEIPCGIEAGYKVTVEQLEAAKTDKTRALIMCSPSNPTGAVYTASELEAIGKWCVENEVWVITDEIYEHLVYGANEFHSIPVVVPELADQCIVVNGVAKTFAMTGWRVGWIIAPADVASSCANLQSHQTSNVANVSQQAALAALEGGLDCVTEMRVAFDRRRQLIYKMLNETKGFNCAEPEGAFYAFPSVQNVVGTSVGGRQINTSMELAEVLLDEAKVACVPGEAFGSPGYLRFSYALGDSDIEEGISRVIELLNK